MNDRKIIRFTWNLTSWICVKLYKQIIKTDVLNFEIFKGKNGKGKRFR